jgi:hypothetical protein
MVTPLHLPVPGNDGRGRPKSDHRIAIEGLARHGSIHVSGVSRDAIASAAYAVYCETGKQYAIRRRVVDGVGGYVVWRLE